MKQGTSPPLVPCSHSLCFSYGTFLALLLGGVLCAFALPCELLQLIYVFPAMPHAVSARTLTMNT